MLVCDSACHVEHDDGTIALNVVAIAKSTKLFLTCCVPHVEANNTVVCVKVQGAYFDTKCGDVFPFKLASQMALDKGSLSDTTIADQDKFLRDLVCEDS